MQLLLLLSYYYPFLFLDTCSVRTHVSVLYQIYDDFYSIKKPRVVRSFAVALIMVSAAQCHMTASVQQNMAATRWRGVFFVYTASGQRSQGFYDDFASRMV